MVESFRHQLNEPTNLNSIKVPKVFEPTNKKKRYFITFGPSVINSPMSPPSLGKFEEIFFLFSFVLKLFRLRYEFEPFLKNT